MNNLKHFVETITKIGWGPSDGKNIEKARQIVCEINRFLFARNASLGTLQIEDDVYQYFSPFHEFWAKNYKEILEPRIDEEACSKVADILFSIHQQTNGRAFTEIMDTAGLSKDDYCRVRLLTANQDFRGSRKLSDFAQVFRRNPALFDVDNICNNPAEFLKGLGITNLSQNDKRLKYAKTFAAFVKKHGGKPRDLAMAFGNDLRELRKQMTECKGAGYGHKKTDMVIRDMVVQEVWTEYSNLDAIDVASDINTVGVALRTGILKTQIPLLSSFLDEFCYQYSYIDEMTAKAWRRVWELWGEKHPDDRLLSPCFLDFFIYNVIGKQFCKKNLAVFECENRHHTFRWYKAQKENGCPLCKQAADSVVLSRSPQRNAEGIFQFECSNGHRFNARGSTRKRCPLCDEIAKGPVRVVEQKLPCDDEEGFVMIQATDYVKSGAAPQDLKQCPFKNVCDACGRKSRRAPRSISIFGRTGWTDAYSDENGGGGGLMA